MKFSYGYPITRTNIPASLIEQEAIKSITSAAEAAGFGGICFTDHPAPSEAWRDDYGHDALDPFIALAFAAANSTRLLLMPHLLVVPYRNPFLIAKSVVTLDRLSSGRLILGVGTGYLPVEFLALGVDFAVRNEIFDESLDVMRQAWTGKAITYQGRSFRAEGTMTLPTPRQIPHPPIWIGGNSTKSRDRVAEYGQGWMPIPTSGVQAIRRRMPTLESVEELASLVDDLRHRFELAGRSPVFDVMYNSLALDESRGTPYMVEQIKAYEDAGVTWLMVGGKGDSPSAAIEYLQWFGENVITQFDT